MGSVGVRGEATLVVDGDGMVSEWIRLSRSDALELSVLWSVSDAPYDADPSLSMKEVPGSGTTLLKVPVSDGLHVLSRRNEVSVNGLAVEVVDWYERRE